MIGNYILENGVISKVVQLDSGGESFCEINNIKVHKLTGAEISSHKVIFEPIILSEEILLKCGFVKDNEDTDNAWLKLKVDNIAFMSDESIRFSYIVVYINGKELKIDYHYLHELQQLYKILTKQELEIEL